MHFGDWEAKLVENPGMLSIDLWLSRRVPEGREILVHDGVVKRFMRGTVPDANDYFIRFETLEQVQAMADAFAKFGVKTNSDHKNEGLLEAKDAHLQDMRALVFKGKQQVES